MPNCETLIPVHVVVVGHIDEVRLCLRTAATNGPIVHPLCDI
jgi:hypothetical protein